MKKTLEQFEKIIQMRDVEISVIETQIEDLQDKMSAVNEAYSQNLADLAAQFNGRLKDCHVTNLIDAPKVPGNYLYRDAGAPWQFAKIHTDQTVSLGLSEHPIRVGLESSYISGGEWASIQVQAQ